MTRQLKASAGMNEDKVSRPVFTETMQIGIVVRDLDATVRRYVEDYGIGPWQFHEFKPGDFKEWREHGEPAESFSRIATAMVGRVQWELIEPLGDKGILARFLAEKGEGVHHIAVATANFDETLATEAKRRNELALSCELKFYHIVGRIFCERRGSRRPSIAASSSRATA